MSSFPQEISGEHIAHGHEVEALERGRPEWRCATNGRGSCGNTAAYRTGYRYYRREQGYVWCDFYVCRRHAEMFAIRHGLEMPEKE